MFLKCLVSGIYIETEKEILMGQLITLLNEFKREYQDKLSKLYDGKKDRAAIENVTWARQVISKVIIF
jgi:hypothetical protein